MSGVRRAGRCWRGWAFAALALLWAGAAGAAAAQPAPWLDAAGRPTDAARQAVALLADAASHGLAPAHYGAEALQRALRAADPPAEASTEPGHAARLAAALEAAFARYLSDLHQGRVDPRALQQDYEPPRRAPFDPAATLRQALADGRGGDAVQAAAAQAAPALPQYQALREALARYRALAGDPSSAAAWSAALPPLPADPRGRATRAAKLQPGQPWAGTAALAQRLRLLGDLPATAALAPGRYEGALVDALRAFQQRHGLADDGVLGAATLAALQVPPAARVAQIGLALERLRWTPLRQGPRMVVVNVPEFVLRAYEVVDGRIRVQAEMKVVVGQALDKQTPLFDEAMRFIEFSPYWNVPPSIARAETVPRLRREPGYWAREGFEFVGADGRVDTALSAAGLNAVLAGRARIRQRPGPANALGDIKFVFPNREHIFLHHTPATALFERSRRDFSHGCIRVEQPVALARFVLQGQPDAAAWTDERIRAEMASGQSHTLRLAAPVPVLIAYGTTLVKAGRIHFLDDVYGQDRRLAAALQQARPPLPGPD